MITLDQAKQLRHGEVVHQTYGKRDRSDGVHGGVCKRWRIMRKVQTWKRSQWRVRIPIKYGLSWYGAIHEDNLDLFHMSNECPRESPEEFDPTVLKQRIVVLEFALRDLVPRVLQYQFMERQRTGEWDHHNALDTKVARVAIGDEEEEHGNGSAKATDTQAVAR